MVHLLSQIYKDYMDFEEIGKIRIKGWKGKSSIEIIKKFDKIIIEKWQRPAKGEEPKKVKIEASKQELNALISSINLLNLGDSIKTKDLAREYCKLLNLTHDSKKNRLFEGSELIWNNFFGWRPMHNQFTLMLDAFDEEGVIEYKGGKTRVLEKNKLNVQTFLK